MNNPVDPTGRAGATDGQDGTGSVPRPAPPPRAPGSPDGLPDSLHRCRLASRRLDRPLCLLAWAAILLIAVLVMLGQASRNEEDADQSAAGDPGLALRLVELQGRYIVGTASLSARAGGGSPSDLRAATSVLNGGPLPQRLRYVVVTSDVLGPEAGLTAAEDLRSLLAEHEVDLSPQDGETLDAIERTLSRRAEGVASAVPDAATQDLLRSRLGWFGDLLLTPAVGDAADPDARRALVRPTEIFVVGVVVLVVAVVAIGIAGLIGAVVLLILGAIGRWRPAFTTGTTRGGVYAETFAVWFVLFLVLSIAASLLPEGIHLFASGAAFLASLSALAWPTVRGIPWGQVRQDIGLHAGRGILIESACGVAAYAMALPLVGLGLLVMFGLMALWGVTVGGSPDEFEFGGSPSHPILEWMGGGRTSQLAALVLAALVAPVVEEIVFRGVLYRHLREGTRRLGAVLSVIASMVLVGVVFAAIHPQGVFAIPVLAALACGFAFAREWRDSLVPAMVAHALNNGAVVALLVVAFS